MIGANGSNGDGRPVALYLRVSTDEQRESGTIQNQADFLARYCDLNGLAVFDLYKDEGVSGTLPLDRRPAGARLLQGAKAGKFGAVLVYRLDRMARSLRVLLDTYDALEAAGVALRSATEPIDTGTPVGRFVFQLIGSMAELERSTILERTASGKRRAAGDGRWLGGPPPYGYRVEGDKHNRRLVVYMPEATIVIRIFELYVREGMATWPIANLLNAEGVPSPTAGRKDIKVNNRWPGTPRWADGTVGKILKDTAYIGRFRHRLSRKYELEESPCPRIVSDDLFEAAQRRLKENFIEASRNARRFYLLRGLVSCAVCKKRRLVGGTLGNKKYAYYYCPKDRYRLRAEALEDEVWALTTRVAKDPQSVLINVEAALRAEVEQESDDGVEQEQIAAKMAEIDRKAADVLDHAGDPTYRQWVDEKLRDLADQKKALQARLEQIFAAEQRRRERAQALISVERYLQELGRRIDAITSPEEKRRYLKGLDVRVWVDKDGLREFGFQPQALAQVLGLDGSAHGADCSIGDCTIIEPSSGGWA